MAFRAKEESQMNKQNYIIYMLVMVREYERIWKT